MKVEDMKIEKIEIIVGEKKMMSIIGISKTTEIIMIQNNTKITQEKMVEMEIELITSTIWVGTIITHQIIEDDY